MKRSFIALVALLLGPAVLADEPDYVRFVEKDDGSASLDTAITSFTDKSGVIIDLVGAVHVADKAYFLELNTRFKAYDAVLYELVGGPMPETAKLASRPQDPKLAWIGQLHHQLRTTLALSSQLEDVDYQAKNFVHADMTTAEFHDAREQKGESFLGLMLKAMAVQHEAGQEGGPGLVRLLEILMMKDSANAMKRLVGEEFDNMETLMAGIESGGGTVIVTERNKVALKKMDELIKSGRKRVAIFYGAAHLPSMETSLLERGCKKGSTVWLKAWDIPAEKK
jgi:hypothetical protein